MKNELKKYELKDNFVVIDVEHKKPHAGIGYGRFYITEDEILEIADKITKKRKNICLTCACYNACRTPNHEPYKEECNCYEEKENENSSR